MITEYRQVVDMMKLIPLLLLIVTPLSLIPTVTSATSNNSTTISEIVSDISSIEIAPVLLAPIATSANNVYIAWPSNQTGHLEILFRASSDNGQTFIDKVNLSNTPNVDSIDPQLATSGNNHVYVSWWEDYGNGTRIPFFTSSNDNGRTFQSAMSLSDDGPIPVQDIN